MAGLQPHVLVLSIIKQAMEEIRNDPVVLDFILNGYRSDGRINAIYGNTFINSAIEFIQENKLNYNLGYRLDIAKLPNISVLFEGANESDQFMGDFGRTTYQQSYPKKYATFHATDLDEFGNLLVSKDYLLHEHVWPKLQIRNPSGVTRTITSILQPPPPNDNYYTILLDEPLTYEDGLSDWTAISPNKTKIYTIGTSLDQVTVRIYLDVPGDPEVCEILSSVVRHALKQSRLTLAEYGINVATFRYSAIGRNESYAGQNCWTAEFTIMGRMTDEWIMGSQETIDSIELNVGGMCCGNDD